MLSCFLNSTSYLKLFAGEFTKYIVNINAEKGKMYIRSINMNDPCFPISRGAFKSIALAHNRAWREKTSRLIINSDSH